MSAAHPRSPPPHAPRDGVLITRAAQAGAATADRVRALGLRPVLAPISAIAPLAAAWPPASRLQAVLVTSANALPGLPAPYRRLRLFAVGDATARLATMRGFADVRSAAGDAAALAALVGAAARPAAGPLLLATGEGQGGALAAALRHAGFIVLRRAAYATRPEPALPAAARMALAQGVLCAALFYSAEGAALFVRLLKDCLAPATVQAVDALALSQSVGAALSPLPWQRIRVASHPNQDELLGLLR
jgi:uroporphyrinogen-III synthase